MVTEDESLNEGFETTSYQIAHIRMRLVLARKFGESGQILRWLSLMIQTLDECLQIQMIRRFESYSQILGHETIEIGTHHFPADMHATAFVADEITQRHCLFRDSLTIVKTSIRTRSDDTGDAFLMAQQSMTCRHQIMGYMDVGIRKMRL